MRNTSRGWSLTLGLGFVGACTLACSDAAAPTEDEGADEVGQTDSSTDTETETETGESSSTETETETESSSETETDTETGTESDTDTDESSSETQAPPCNNTVVVTGYWPPTNEMLRPWSQNPDQNPEGWMGANWHDHGYDVYAFFPEFPPDGDPTNDELGDPGAVGSPESDLQVDYQDTSQDFWAIVDEYAPAILITTSRGGEIGWELEAVEGGHAAGGPQPALDWYPDGYGEVIFPTQDSIEARSWAGISTYRQGDQLPSQLPLEAILDATAALNLTTVAIDQETSGNFLSGFMGLHGLLYNLEAEDNLAAGHIHVGFGLPVDDARALIETTLDVVLEAHPLDCEP
ncbi:hypothetical protein [Plesiocystis pacifica]|uniref:hypothetical protein n=1 Tax=Plesiocystis pacifica TaxID=191768 RepID=UPI0012FAAA4E|nr:hypothetical protein [Plesiocystis pacifica]